MGLLAIGLAVVEAALLSRVAAGVLVGRQHLTALAPFLAWIAAVALVRGAGLGAAEVAGQRAANLVKAAARSRLFGEVVFRGPDQLREERTGEVAATLGQGVEELDGVRTYVPQLALAALGPLLVLGVYSAVDPLSALAVLLIAPFIPLLTALIGLRVRDLMARRMEELARMSAHFLDVLQGLPTLKLFGQSGPQAAGIAGISERYRRSTMDVLRVAFQTSLVIDLAATMGVALVAIEVGTRLLARSLPFERALFILLLAPEFFLPIRQVAAARHARLAAHASATRLFELLEGENEGRRPLPRSPGESGAKPREGGTALALSRVTYTPPDRTAPALRDVSLTLREGETVAVVGPSGAGKTTLLKLLLGFIAPDSGSICAGGEPLAGLERDDWLRQVAWVPQLPHVFAETVGDNVRLMRPEATVLEVEAAARAACAHDFISSLPRGYDTYAGEKGARLSGGQRQRLALARAFLADRPVLLLDEPTVHLDPELAREVRAAIRRLCLDRTALIVTHDLELAALADRLLVLDRGRLVQGAPAA